MFSVDYRADDNFKNAKYEADLSFTYVHWRMIEKI